MYKFTDENVTYIVERGDLQWGFAGKKITPNNSFGVKKSGDMPKRLSN
jgi:hypothetical protein